MDEPGLQSKMHCKHLRRQRWQYISHHFIKGGVNNSPLLTRCSISVIIMSGHEYSKGIKRRVGFSFTVRNSRRGLTVVETNLLS